MSSRSDQGLVLALALVPVAVVSLRDCAEEDRRGSTREAVAQLADLSAATVVAASRGPGGCPSPPGSVGGAVGPTPPLTLDCNRSPSKQCSSTFLPRAVPASYWRGLWDAEAMWRAIGFALDRPHRYHYALSTALEPGPRALCRFRARAHGDLDGDGVFSTIEIRGVVDGEGATLEVPWYLIDPLE